MHRKLLITIFVLQYTLFLFTALGLADSHYTLVSANPIQSQDEKKRSLELKIQEIQLLKEELERKVEDEGHVVFMESGDMLNNMKSIQYKENIPNHKERVRSKAIPVNAEPSLLEKRQQLKQNIEKLQELRSAIEKDELQVKETQEALRNEDWNVELDAYHYPEDDEGFQLLPDEIERRRIAVRDAFIHTWNGYTKFAFGSDELRPITNEGSNYWGSMGVTLVDALDTLLVMDLKNTLDWERARSFVASLEFDKDFKCNVFETSIRMLGGLLSAYSLSKDDIFKIKAKELGDRLLFAFATPSGIPYMDLHLKNLAASNPVWNGGGSVLAEYGGIQLEFRYLSEVTGDPVYAEKVNKVFEVMSKHSGDDGLLPVNFNPVDSRFTTDKITFGAHGDSYYEYLLKQYIQANYTEPALLEEYLKAMKGMEDQLVRKTDRSNLYYIGQLIQNQFLPQMDHLVCFVPGMLALGIIHDPLYEGNDEKKSYENHPHYIMAEELTRTCYEMYRRQQSGLAPEIARFEGKNDFVNHAHHYILRPETVESFFIMYRLTGKQKYQEWGWKIFQALEKHCKTSSGFSGIKNVNTPNPEKDDAMQSFFLSETLKYLYLLFSPSDVIPLDKYVFTTEGHPLEIYQPLSASS